ncbi:MAG: bifunctional DNA-formamidopyrimidine glycosylase/DNA-(apurinic or apyrimidinic site) lyase [Legionellaceae bacterium]|nr:bifunctional DNA-formamidopyrimidine glycosylase/DNA-(apurinic or apyrimidinic site) lyase [Legionellaceae bacterium]
MPELPEVETTLHGIKPHIQDRMIKQFITRQKKLRWPIPDNMQDNLVDKSIINIIRRGKYLLFQVQGGTFIIHLGMSGRLRILHDYIPPEKHDHVDIVFSGNVILRYTDPRRFGSILWDDGDGFSHPLIKNLGIEPFDDEFTGDYLFKLAKTRSLPIKSFIMENKTVVGVGNIYATEALFQTNIHPETSTKLIKLEQMDLLVKEIRRILKVAISQGGTTLKDFLGSDGKPGYFVQNLQVYGRTGLECFKCSTILESLKIGQRTTCFCPTCQV